MHVAICIVGFCNAGDLENCVGAVDRQTHHDLEVVICENGGAEAFCATRSAVAGRPRVRVLHAPDNPGFAGGVNLCMQAAPDADAWWILNPDCEPEPQALATLVARLRTGAVQAVGGVLYGSDGSVQGYGGRWRAKLARAESIGNGAPRSSVCDPRAIESQLDYLLGASMLVGRTFVDRVGLMREDYFLYGEEVEWFLRAKRRNMKLGFAPDAHVLHHQGTTTGAGLKLGKRLKLPIYLDERNKILILRDTDGLAGSAMLGALAMLALRYLVRGHFRQFGYGLAGQWAGLLGHRGKPKWITSNERPRPSAAD